MHEVNKQFLDKVAEQVGEEMFCVSQDYPEQLDKFAAKIVDLCFKELSYSGYYTPMSAENFYQMMKIGVPIMSKASRTKPSLPLDSTRGWLRRFQRAVFKLSPTLANEINWETARYYFESAMFTPESAAALYTDQEKRKAFKHGQSSRSSKG